MDFNESHFKALGRFPFEIKTEIKYPIENRPNASKLDSLKSIFYQNILYKIAKTASIFHVNKTKIKKNIT